MSAQEFSKQRAVDIAVGGRYSLANWYDPQGNRREFACRTSRISPFRMMVSVPVIGKVGDRVSSYFGDFGKLDGVISDTVAGGFLLELAITKAKREQLASKLTWLEKQQKDPTIREVRTQYGKDKIRILYFADSRRVFVLLHGFVKPTAKLEPSELRQAEYGMARHNQQISKKGKHRE